MKWCSGWQKRHHIGWFLPLAFFKPISALPPSEGRPEGPPHPSQCLRGLKPDPSQRGHSSPSCRKHLTSSTDSCAEHAKLICAIRITPWWSGLGVLAHRRGRFYDGYILPEYMVIIYKL